VFLGEFLVRCGAAEIGWIGLCRLVVDGWSILLQIRVDRWMLLLGVGISAANALLVDAIEVKE
jgi:hypothetical protein